MAFFGPEHIGIIMDGNGRWAQLKGRHRAFGHIKGARVAKKIITDCAEKKIKSLTLYAFSTENWLRPKEEVSFLMSLLKRYLKREVSNLIRQNIKFCAIGDFERLPDSVRKIVVDTMNLTKDNSGMLLTFALSYGGHWEITEAVKTICKKVVTSEYSVDEISPKLVERHLCTYPNNHPDLIIRTSGERRLSNFLLWQSAYSELFFSDTYWPDFGTEEFGSILLDYQKRIRRFGAIESEVENSLN